MSSRTGSWIIALGALITFLGLCVLAVSFGKSGDPDELASGAGFFSMGAVAVAAGIYFKARALQSSNASDSPRKESPAANRTRGGCELCGTEAPVIQCKVHQLQMCGACLSQHYDARSCIYLPRTRGTSAKSNRGLSKARGA
jgi:hypothetical protein